MLFDTFVNKITITGFLEAIDPIHIGASAAESLDPTQVDNSVLKDADGLPIIPGSSLKGVVRSDFEGVMRAVGKNVCDIFNVNDTSCTDNKFIDSVLNSSDLSELEKANALYERSCDVCRLFGGRGLASHLSFKDCAFIGDKCIFEHRDGIGIDRDTGTAARGCKYEFEIIPKGSRFSFCLIAENLEEEQKNYLYYILRRLMSAELSIGGKTTRGFGRIKLFPDFALDKQTGTYLDFDPALLNPLWLDIETFKAMLKLG